MLRSGLKPELARSISRREYHRAAERELAFVERHRIRAIEACLIAVAIALGAGVTMSIWLSVSGGA